MAELRQDRAIGEFDHRMHNALRMNHHFDARHLDVEKPARFDHFEAFVEERGGIDRDLGAHVPGRVTKRPLFRDRTEFLR